MKNIILSLFSLMLSLGMQAQNIWSGETKFDASWGVHEIIGTEKFADVQVADMLAFTVKDVVKNAECQWPQIQLGRGDWSNLACAANTGLSETSTTVKYGVTTAMLAELKKNGMIVTGVGYTLTSIDVIDPTSLPNITTSLAIDDSDWVWENGATPEIKVNITNNGTEPTKASIEVTVDTDKRKFVKAYTENAELESGTSQTVAMALTDIKDPGFYVVTVLVNDELVRSFTIGVNPREIVSSPDKLSDFDSFWAAALDELKSTDMDVKLTKLDDKSTSNRTVYLVEMKGVANGDGQPVNIRGYYAEPVAPGKYPCCIHFQGYDNRDSYDLWCPGGNDHNGWCDFVFFHRGQYLNNRLHNPEDDFYGDYFVYNFGKKDSYYYRGAFMDCVRAIDFVASREHVDANNIFAQGASQGGALTIAAAALSGKLQAIAPSIQFLGDFPDYFELAQWPANTARNQQQVLGMSDEDMFAFFSYFDTKNLATAITCPVISSIGLQDDVCPPHTNMAPLNNLASKEVRVIFQPECKHGTDGDWWNVFFDFFEKHMYDPSGVERIENAGVRDNSAYNLAGQRVADGFRGLVVTNGKKIIVK